MAVEVRTPGTVTVELGDFKLIPGPQGERGPRGYSVESVVMNPDYTLTFNLENGNSYTTPVIRGVGATIRVSEDTITGGPGESASVENIGTETAAVLRFKLPQGPQGPAGRDGEVTREALDVALQSKANRNLLDNWYFVGGGSQQGGGQFPINQRGQTVYTGQVYGIDMWKGRTAQSTVSVENNGITITKNTGIDQHIETSKAKNLDGILTASILTVDGRLISGTVQFIYNSPQTDFFYFVRGDVTIYIDRRGIFGIISDNSPITIVAAKLELGPAQTLAHQENGVWVLNEAPDYQKELDNCRRYQLFNIANTRCYLFSAGNIARFSVNTPVTMRSVPAIVGRPTVFRFADNVPLSPSSIKAAAVTGNGVVVEAAGISEDCYLTFGEGSSGFDANL